MTPAARSGGSGWCLVLLVALVAGLAAVPYVRGLAPRVAREAAAAAPVAWVDPAGARIGLAPVWADPRWLEHVNAVVARRPPFPLDAAGPHLTALEAELAALPFVARVEASVADPARGLALALALRKPVACVPVRGEFLLVDEEGVVLEGRWPLPPRLGRAPLPVLGPAGETLFERARPGDWLAEPEHLDALAVAVSLGAHLGEPERAALGRVAIDARTARDASPDEPGVRLELEGGRVALFGRAPGCDEPGELAEAAKWSALSRALALFARDPAVYDWELVDLRWDRPDLALRASRESAEVTLARAEADAFPRARSGRGEPGAAQSRVR